MANWTGKARTNYILVKDVEALKAKADEIGIKVEVHTENPNFVTFEPDQGDDGDFETSFINDDEVEVEWTWSELSEHFAEGQVLIVMTVGGERTRYLTGFALAVAWDGRVTSINLNDIYLKAAQTFGVEKDRIAPAQYDTLPKVI